MSAILLRNRNPHANFEVFIEKWVIDPAQNHRKRSNFEIDIKAEIVS